MLNGDTACGIPTSWIISHHIPTNLPFLSDGKKGLEAARSLEVLTSTIERLQTGGILIARNHLHTLVTHHQRIPGTM
jgi:hypothetical protein